MSLDKAIDADMHTMTTRRGNRVCFYSDASAEGRPLVLLHSINAAPSSMEMRPLFERYRGSRPVYALDLPGFGMSQRSIEAFDAALFAECIAEFCRTLPGDPPDVIALSLTGEFVARAVLENGLSIASLTLISPTGVGDRLPPGPDKQARVRSVLNFAGVGRGLFSLLRTRPSIRYFFSMNFVGKVPPPLIDYAVATTREKDAHRGPLTFLTMGLFTANASEVLFDKLDAPLLVLYDRDPNVSFERLENLLKKPNCTSKRIHPTLGMPHWEQPDATWNALDSFWDSPPTAVSG
jgi:pimeloyl-ACP methyl ester carboxylesterase